MSQQKNQTQLNYVYIVTCFQNLIGVYADEEDAIQAQRSLIVKNRPADVLCRQIIYPLNSTQNG